MAAVNNNAKRNKTLLINYAEAIKLGPNYSFIMRNKSEDNYEEYYILLKPIAGLYKGQKFILEFKTSYGSTSNMYKFPISPPNVKFITPILHTNVSSSGSICLDIFSSNTAWSPSYTFISVITSILLLLETPNNTSPFNTEANSLHNSCNEEFKNNTKGQKLTIKDEELMKEHYFSKFIEESKKRSSDFNFTPYGQWFPELIGEKDTFDYNQFDNILNPPSIRSKKNSNVSVNHLDKVEGKSDDKSDGKSDGKSDDKSDGKLVDKLVDQVDKLVDQVDKINLNAEDPNKLPKAPVKSLPKWAKYKK